MGKGKEKGSGFRDLKDIKEYLKGHSEIRFIRPVFADIVGTMNDFAVPVGKVESLFQEGAGFDGSSVAGFREGVNESDLVFRPEARTFMALPWVYERKVKSFNGEAGYGEWREAIVFGGIYTPKGSKFEGDTRNVLKKMLQKMDDSEDIGPLKMLVGPELEFFLFPDDKTPVPTDAGGYHKGGRYGEMRKEVQLLFDNIDWECDHHEVAPGQHEIDLKYGDALEMADRVLLARAAIKKVAKEYGLYASFMPKPINGQNGSGMHVHQSLWKGKKNLFFGRKDKYNLSDVARGYIVGLLERIPEITLVLNQYPNSFKRLVPGFEAPTYIAWGQENRSSLVRVPQYAKDEGAARIELRSPDPAMNPYLGFSVMLAAGLEGYRRLNEGKLKLPDPIEENIFEMAPELRAKRGIKDLPPDMGAAIAAFESSGLAMETLGEHVYREILRNKKAEWGRYNSTVTDFDIREYLPKL